MKYILEVPLLVASHLQHNLKITLKAYLMTQLTTERYKPL